MITFFTTAKPFRGHDGIIQRNALKSWKLLHPEVDVILFGDDEGTAEVCSELGLVHHAYAEKHESGKKQLDYMFRSGTEIARHDYLCYANCDIVLTEDFWRAFKKARRWRSRFLLVSRRWDVDITAPVDFTQVAWAKKLRESTLTSGLQRDGEWIDLFLFRKGLYVDMPPLIVGHCYWDGWMIWKARNDGVAVLDVSRAVISVHQNHGYNAPQSRNGAGNSDALSQRNLQLIGGLEHIRHIGNSTHWMTGSGWILPRLRRNLPLVLEPPGPVQHFLLYRMWLPVWHFLLGVTRPVRNLLGLRSKRARPREGV